MDSPDPDIWARFGRLLSGDASESDELAHWERLASDPAYKASWDAAQVSWGGMVPSPRSWDATAARTRLDARLRRPLTSYVPLAPWHRRWRVRAGVAAAALSVAAIVGLRLAPDRNSPTVPTSAAAERREDAVANAATHAGAQRDTAPVTSASFSTPAGRSRRVPLPDGSTITLMPGSTLLLRRTAAEPWGTHDRHVMLTGEASFSVRRDTLRPFIVHSGHAEVRVLGTEFVVSSYIARHGLRGRDVIGVAVREGRVGVRHLHGSEPDTTPMRILRGGDAIAMSPSGAMSSIRAADLLELHDGNLVFDQAPLGDVMREITRWYAVTATFAPDVPPALRVTTTITRGTLDDVIDQLGFTTGLRISRVGRSVHVAPAAP